MADVGRPRSYNAEQVEKSNRSFLIIYNRKAFPIIAEFAYKNEIPRTTFYDYEEFSTLVKMCIDKKEAQLEKLGLQGEVNTPMAIFSLKQLGWTDKQETSITGGVQIVYADADDKHL